MPSDGSIQTAEGTSRKRVKISRDAGRPAGQLSKSAEVVSLISSPSKTALKQEPTQHVDESVQVTSAPCHHEQAFKTLTGDLDAMRQLITCKICDRFLYEPYSLTCGHTYCYSCLSSWTVDNHKKTCPDCRAIIKDQPAPSYVIREMVLIFASKSELLPDGETSEEHAQLAKEESELVSKDKANTDRIKGGLFKGHFKRGGRAVPLLALRDPSDNVWRCPQCINEIEDGWCLHCHVRVATGEDEDDSDDDTFSNDSLELDHDLDAVDHDIVLDGDASDWSGYADFMGDHRHFDDFGFAAGADGRIDLYSEDESEDDSEHDPDMDGFINDDTIEIEDSDEGSEGTAIARRAAREPPIALSDDEEEHHEPAPRRRRLVAAFRRPRAPSSADGSSHASENLDSEDEGPISASQRQRGQNGRRVRQRPIRIDSDEDEDSDATQTTSRSVNGGFSPLEPNETNDGVDEASDLRRSASVLTDGSRGTEEVDLRDEDDEDESDDNEISLHERSGSVMSRATEDSMEEEDDDDEDDNDDMRDESDDDNNTPYEYNSHPYSHRLHTLGPHSVRHADPATSYSRHLPPPRRGDAARPYPYSHPYTDRTFTPLPTVYPPPTEAARVGPAHPFGLGNVLNRLQPRTTPRLIPASAPLSGRRHGSNVSSQSSAGGGVDVLSSESGSSGNSSQTLQAPRAAPGRRRRRSREVERDEDN